MKKCSLCSRLYDDSQSFCLDDGTALVADSNIHSAETVVIPAKKSRMPIVFGGVLMLIVACIGAAWIVLKNADGQKGAVATNVKAVPTPVQPVKVTPPPEPSPAPTEASAETPPDTISTSKSAETVDPTTLPPIMKAEDHSVLFNLHQCRKSGSEIVCDLTITNKGPDRRFEFTIYRSNLFDELGNTYNGRNGRIASRDGGSPDITFVSGVTAKAQITFAGIQPNAVKITLLRLQYDVGDDRGLEIKFRNIPLMIPK